MALIGMTIILSLYLLKIISLQLFSQKIEERASTGVCAGVEVLTTALKYVVLTKVQKYRLSSKEIKKFFKAFFLPCCALNNECIYLRL